MHDSFLTNGERNRAGEIRGSASHGLLAMTVEVEGVQHVDVQQVILFLLPAHDHLSFLVLWYSWLLLVRVPAFDQLLIM